MPQSLPNNPPLIWFKGRLVPHEEAFVPVLSPTAQFGLNVFEGIRGYSSDSGQIFLFRLVDHLRRLMKSCDIMGIQSPYSVDEIASFIISTIRKNHMTQDLALRVALFVEGMGSWSSSGPVDMFIAPIFKPRNILTEASGQSACISTWRRIDDTSLPPRIKTGANYINGRYAHLEAQNIGVNLPILLNSSGKIAEGAGSCLMMVRNGTLVTPPVTASILESITRDTLLTLADDGGICTQEREIDRTELYLAEEVFLCGSSAEITPIISIDRFTIGDGSTGQVSSLLSSLYFASADGSNSDHPEWLTPVYS